MLRGAIVVNSFWRGGDERAREIADALRALGVPVDILRSGSLSLGVGKGLQGTFPYSFAVYSDKDDHRARLLEASGVRLFNSAETIRLCDDKMLTHIALAPYVRQPKTIPSPLFFAGEDGGEFLRNTADALGFPIVVKKCFGAFGEGVYLARNAEDLRALRASLLREPHLYQEFVDCGGCDVRVITIGGKAVVAMKRRAATPGEFRANAELGGRGEAIPLTEEIREIAETASRALKADFAGVDLLWDKEGYLVTEVNSNAHFRLIREVTGVEIAALYAKYILSEIRKGGEV